VNIHRVDAGTLELGGGLETLVRAALENVPVGGELEIMTASRGVAFELPAWARIAGHQHVGDEMEGHGATRRFVVRIRRGGASRLLADELPPRGDSLTTANGRLHMAELRRVEPSPTDADPHGGLVPLGALTEAGGPQYAWRLNERDRIWADELASLTERATKAQWNATLDIPWNAASGLPTHTEQAVAQVMTYIAQNEYAALYVPARFLPQVNPRYTEVLLWLASHVHDEARHVEVFTKRALAGGARAHALASTDLSLHSLLEENDFSAAALLLNVLGEGTFLDLLRFVEHHAPDAATATAARLAHRDERRHVQFGIAHIRRRLTLEPDERTTLISAAEARAAKLTSLSGLSPLVTESLTLLAARSLQPADLSEAGKGLRQLQQTMERNRIRRLRAAGFDQPTARYLSDLHTPNLM
jgi:TusA-related sulfurtransferase